MLFCLFLLWFQSAAAQIQSPSTLAQQHAKRGFELSQQGDLKSAESEFRQAIQLKPNDAFALAFLGIILGKQQKLEEADNYFEGALKIEPNDVNTRFNLAVNQFRLGQSLQAKANLERILERKPDTKPAVLLLGTVMEGLKEYWRAVSLLESVPELVRQQPESMATLARCYYHTNLPEKARETLEALRPAGPEAIFLWGETAAQSADFETAEKLLNSIQSTYPDKVKLGYEIALIQYNAKHFVESRSTLQQLVAAGDREAKVFNLLSWCYHRQNLLLESVAAMKQAIELEPAAEINYNHLVQILLEERQYSDAYDAAKRAVEVAPDSCPAYKLKAQAESQIGIFKQARESYARAVELNAGDADSLLGLGLVQKKLFQFTEAVTSFERGIARFPRHPQFYQAYGRMLLEPGTRRDAAAESRAVSLLKKALELDNSLPEAHFVLGKFLLGQEKAAEALPHLEAAAKLDPRSSKIHLSLANAYRRLGRSEESASELQLFKKLEAQEERDP